MTQVEVTADVCYRLEQAGIAYVIGGSVAAGMWGEPRYTNDVDLGIWLSPLNSENLVAAFSEPYLISANEIQDALSSTDEYRMVQVLHMDEGMKFDFFLEGHSPIDREAHELKKKMEIMPGRAVWFSCAEHILVQKMRWYEAGRRTSERQWRDMVAILRVTDVDWPLVEKWTAALGLEEVLAELKQEVESP